MAILGENNDETTSPTSPNPVEKPDYQGTQVNSRYTSITSLLTHMEGYSWTVVMYHQLLGDNETGQAHSLELDASLQQYQKITDFELRVTDPLTFEYVADFDADSLSGTGLIYPGTIIPQVGDTFVADVGDGRTGIFHIQSVTPRSLMNDRAYEVEYYLTTYSTTERLDDLEYKSVQEGHFSKSFLQQGQNPIIESQERDQINDLTAHRNLLVQTYIEDFIDRGRHYLLAPGQERLAYDPFLSTYLQKTVNISQYAMTRDAYWPDIRKVFNMRLRTLWDLLTETTPTTGRIAYGTLEQSMVLESTFTIRAKPAFTSLYYSKIERILYPLSETTDADPNYLQRPADEPALGYLDYTLGYWLPDDRSQLEIDITSKPDIYPVTLDNYYVFSSAFYEDDRLAQSKLEYLTSLYLDRSQISAAKLLEVIRSSYEWGSLERFYYQPILWCLIDYTLSRRSM